jgi:23S rRNA pseudouridine1911/1915/1917 synthase
VADAGHRCSWATLLRLKPQTGRTHQIRVHLADQGHPIVGDPVYGLKQKEFARASVAVPELTAFPRQALHAEKLEFVHPATGVPTEFRAPLSQDIEALLICVQKKRLEDTAAEIGG